jgi:hypothetical protein
MRSKEPEQEEHERRLERWAELKMRRTPIGPFGEWLTDAEWEELKELERLGYGRNPGENPRRTKSSLHDFVPAGTEMLWNNAENLNTRVEIIEWNYVRTERIGYDYYDQALVRKIRTGTEFTVPHYQLKLANPGRRNRWA